MSELPQVAPLDAEEQWFSQVTELLTLSLAPCHNVGETHFKHMYPTSFPFAHDPKLMTIGESWNIDGPVN